MSYFQPSETQIIDYERTTLPTTLLHINFNFKKICYEGLHNYCVTTRHATKTLIDAGLSGNKI